jgi:hypothetical protein
MQLNNWCRILILILAGFALCSCPNGKGNGDDTDSDSDTDTIVAVKELTACSSEVPDGAFVTCIIPYETCSSGEKWTYISNADELPSGSQIVICGSVAPSGWTVLSTSLEACCPSGSPDNAIRIQKD